MEAKSNEDLLAAWRGGDAGSFEELVNRHQAALLRHARSLLGDWRGSEDVVQEAFLRLAQSPPELPESVATGAIDESERALRAWLHTVTRNLCMDALRSEKRRKRREEEVASREASSGGLCRVEENDTRAAVEKGLERLSKEQREVLVLRLFGEQSYKEIASITGKKIGTVGWLISVGLKALAGELEPLLTPRAQAQPVTPPRTSVRDAQIGFLHGEMS